MGLLFFSFLHEIITNKFEHIIELEGPSHIFNYGYGGMWKKFMGVAMQKLMVELPTPCFSSLKVFTRSMYDYMIVVHKVAASCICFLSASQHYVQVFMLLPKMW